MKWKMQNFYMQPVIRSPLSNANIKLFDIWCVWSTASVIKLAGKVTTTNPSSLYHAASLNYYIININDSFLCDEKLLMHSNSTSLPLFAILMLLWRTPAFNCIHLWRIRSNSTHNYTCAQKELQVSVNHWINQKRLNGMANLNRCALHAQL